MPRVVGVGPKVCGVRALEVNLLRSLVGYTVLFRSASSVEANRGVTNDDATP